MAFLNSIKVKILIVSIALAALPVIGVSFLLGMQATGAAEQALEEQVVNQLVSIREIKKGQINNYFRLLEKHVRAYSVDSATVLYTQKLNTYFRGDKRKLTDVSAQKENLLKYYQGALSDEYSKWNPAPLTNANDVIAQLEPIGIALQNSFIANNNSAFGEKHNLINPDDGTTYATAHGDSHRVLRRMFQKLTISDMYIVNPDGDVIYSVQKYPDFATNLKTGPYKDSNMARAFQTALDSGDANFVTLSDVASYAGNFNQPSMFIASPIQDLEEADAYEILGVMVFKIDLQQINDIMSSDANWENVGMGKTGEAYLVGADKSLRTDARMLLQDKESYLAKLNSKNVTANDVKTISQQKTAVSRIVIDNAAVTKALAGEVGIEHANNYFGTSDLVAYAPLKIKTLNWAILSTISEQEALAARESLANRINITSLILTAVMIGIAVVVGILFATMITKPIIRASRTMRKIEQTSDLTLRIDVHSNDEIGSMATAMNHMLEKFRSSLEKVAVSTMMLANASEEMSSITQQTSDNVNKQFREIDQVATAMNEMTATVQEVAHNATSAAQAALKANEHSSGGKRVVETTMGSISDLSDELQRVSDVINTLSKNSEAIGAVIDVIKGIAEQTNLLALNAAIEAARAGEQGRGFAVVADEVRTLASRTQKSTGEIENMIEQLQKAAQQAVQAVNTSRGKSQESVEHAASTGDSLTTIAQSINEINDMNTMIASAAEEQSAVTEEINKNIVTIRIAAEETTRGADQTTLSSQELSKLSAELQDLVAKFKTA